MASERMLRVLTNRLREDRATLRMALSELLAAIASGNIERQLTAVASAKIALKDTET